MLNGVYCLAAMLQFAAFLKLRRSYPELHRPYRIPLGFRGCAIMLVCPFMIVIVLFLMPWWEGRWLTAGFVVASAAFGAALYAAIAALRYARPDLFLCEPPSAVKPCT